MAEASGVPASTIRRVLQGRPPSDRTRTAVVRAVEDLSTEAPVPDEGWRIATGGARYMNLAGGLLGEARVWVYLGWTRVRRQLVALDAGSTCAGCGEPYPEPLHACTYVAGRPCACGCGETIPDGARSDRRYVSDAHRMRATRARDAM